MRPRYSKEENSTCGWLCSERPQDMKSHSTFWGRVITISVLPLECGQPWGRKSKIIEYIQAAIGEYVRWGSVRHGIPFRTWGRGKRKQIR